MQPMLRGSSANENAFKLAMMHPRSQERGGAAWSEEELDSCMRNHEPESPDLKIVSFSGAFHGRTLGALSVTRSKQLHKVALLRSTGPWLPFLFSRMGRQTRPRRTPAKQQQACRPLERSWIRMGPFVQ